MELQSQADVDSAPHVRLRSKDWQRQDLHVVLVHPQIPQVRAGGASHTGQKKQRSAEESRGWVPQA